MDIYADNILDHYRSPRGQVPLTNVTVEHVEENASCGDTLTLQLQIDNGRMTGVSWSGTGCAISQAAMSILSEELQNMSVTDVEKLTPDDIYKMLGVPIGPRRFKCALLGLHTLKNALRKNAGLPLEPWTSTVGLEN